MEVARFRFLTVVFMIVVSSFFLFIPLADAWLSYRRPLKDTDIIRISIGPTIYGLSTSTKQYFKYVVRQEMLVMVRMWPSPDADYDLYGKFTPDTLPQGTLAGDPVDDTDFGLGFGGPGDSEAAGALLGPGTYYIMVHNYSGTGTYDLGVYGHTPKSHQPEMWGWFNNTYKGTALKYPYLFVTPNKVFSLPSWMDLSYEPVVYRRDNRWLEYYETNEFKLAVFFLGTRKGTLCLARLNDKTTGDDYFLAAFRKNS